MTCEGSPFALGTSNMPPDTSGSGQGSTELVNIMAIENAQGQVAGWIYGNAKGQFFWQDNPNQPIIAASFIDLLPGVGQAAKDFLSSIGPQQIGEIDFNAIYDEAHAAGYQVHDCFTGSLNNWG
jgi:hypothetical protein